MCFSVISAREGAKTMVKYELKKIVSSTGGKIALALMALMVAVG